MRECARWFQPAFEGTPSTCAIVCPAVGGEEMQGTHDLSRTLLVQDAMDVGSTDAQAREVNRMECGQRQSMKRKNGSLDVHPMNSTPFLMSSPEAKNLQQNSSLPTKAMRSKRLGLRKQQQQDNLKPKDRNHTGLSRYPVPWKEVRTLPSKAWMLDLLMILMMTTKINGLEPTLGAFNCNSPLKLQDYQVVARNDSCGQLPSQFEQTLQPYAIVQKRSYNKATGFKCTKKISRFTFICTANALAAHQRLAAIPQVEVPQDLSREECQELIRTEEFEGPDGVKHRVPLGKTTVLRFHEAGREEISGTYLWEEVESTMFQQVRSFLGQIAMEEDQESWSRMSLSAMSRIFG